MKRSIGIASTLFFGLLTGACSNDGRPRFISDLGVSKEVNSSQGDELTGDGLLYQFKLAASAARPFTSGPKGALLPNDPEKQRAFMDAGFSLIQARCNNYILSKADNQRQVNVWRDTFAPITALLTGAVAIISKGDSTSNDALTALSLGTSAASAGFRIYEQRFLFGAENVNSVRLLVLRALINNSSEASKTSNAKLDYSQTVTHLINNQAICSPGHILQLVSEAIEAGKIVSIKSDSNSPPPVESKAELEAKEIKALLDQLKKDKALTDQEIAAAKLALSNGKPPAVVAQPASDGLEIVTTKVINSQ